MPGSAQTKILAAGQPVAVAGEATKFIDGESCINAEAATNLGFGLGVKPGTKVKEVLLPTASNSVFRGVVVQNRMHSPGTFGDIDDSGSPPGMKPKTSVEILAEGRCWVVVDGDTVITPGVTRAFWRFETDGASNTLVGTFRHNDDTHVVDVRGQVLFVSGVMDAADVLKGAGSQKIAEVMISRSNKA